MKGNNCGRRRKKIAIKIKEILDLHVPKKAKNQIAIDFTMAEASTVLKNGYVLYLKSFLEPNQYIRSKDIACNIFNKIEFEDFSKEKNLSRINYI